MKATSLILLFFLSIALVFGSCSDEADERSKMLEPVLVVDSISMYVVSTEYPQPGEPVGLFVFEFSYLFGGAPGAIDIIEIIPSPPGGIRTSIHSNSGYDREPMASGIFYRYENDLRCYADFTPYDSVWVYFSVQARFWSRIESKLIESPAIFPMGDDRYYTLMKIEVREEQ